MSRALPPRRASDLTGIDPAEKMRLIEMFGDLRVLPAEEKMPLVMKPEDLACAVAGDPCRCAWVRCIERMWGSEWAYVGLTRSYVHEQLPSGEDVLRQYEPSAELREVIDTFDEGKLLNAPKGKRYLKPMKPTRTRELEHEARKLRTARDRKLAVEGKLPPRRPTPEAKAKSNRDMRDCHSPREERMRRLAS